MKKTKTTYRPAKILVKLRYKTKCMCGGWKSSLEEVCKFCRKINVGGLKTLP